MVSLRNGFKLAGSSAKSQGFAVPPSDFKLQTSNFTLPPRGIVRNEPNLPRAGGKCAKQTQFGPAGE
jgi:hypothetical protein